MSFESRSYNPGPVFRPKPFVLERPESGLFIVTTSWSDQTDAERIARLIAQFIEQNPNADEMSRPGQALSAAADEIFKRENLKQARILIEALVVQIKGASVQWAQVGQPNLYLLRHGRVAPLVVQPDHSVLNWELPPLPHVALGLEPQTPVQTGSLRLQAHDELLFLAQSWEPQWPSWSSNPHFSELTKELINSQSNLAFWCGLLSPVSN